MRLRRSVRFALRALVQEIVNQEWDTCLATYKRLYERKNAPLRKNKISLIEFMNDWKDEADSVLYDYGGIIDDIGKSVNKEFARRFRAYKRTKNL